MLVTVTELEKELKQQNPETIFLLYGEEIFLLENSLKKIKKNFGEIVNGINYVGITDTNITDLIQEIQTPAFGYEKKLIIVRNSKIFERGGKNKSKDKEKIVDEINNYIKENMDEINLTCTLVFVEEKIEKNKLYNILEKNGTVCNFEELKPNQIGTKLIQICNAYKVKISNSDISYLIEQCGTSMQDLINEIRKLIEYSGENGTITRKEIDLLCIKQMQAVIFDLTDSLGQKNINKAMEVLNNLLYSKEPIQKIMITLYNHFKKLYITQIAIKENKDIASSLKLKPNQMFLVNKYKMQAKYFSNRELKNILQEMMDLDFKYKQGLIDVEIGLKSILSKYCSK